MMTYWTAMWITMWATGFEGQQAMLPYVSLDACRGALGAVSDSIGYDHTIQCVESIAPSGSIRPMPRPEHLEGHW